MIYIRGIENSQFYQDATHFTIPVYEALAKEISMLIYRLIFES